MFWLVLSLNTILLGPAKLYRWSAFGWILLVGVKMKVTLVPYSARVVDFQ
jgi:hypothetical protein